MEEQSPPPVGAEPGPAEEPQDPLERVPPLARPELLVSVLWGAYLIAAAAPALGAMVADFDEPAMGLAVWLGTTLIFALPAGVVAGVLAARLERAATGLRHPQRVGWIGVGAGAILVSHWIVLTSWSPLAFLSAMSNSYRTEDYLVAAFFGLFAWVVVGGGIALVVGSIRRLRARRWEDVDLPTAWRLSRLDTPVWAAAFYGLLATGPSFLVGAFGTERSWVGAVVGWTLVGAAVAAVAVGLGGRLRRDLPHLRRPVTFDELAGALWVVHWGLVLAWCLLPIFDRGTSRLTLACAAWMMLTAGVYAWAVGRAEGLARRAPGPAGAATG